MNKSQIVLAMGVLALAGCASQDSRQSANEVKQYCAEKFADHRIDPVRERMLIPISVDQPQPIEILANRQRPTSEERKALSALSEARSACSKFTEAHLGVPPGYRQASQDRITASLADLYAGDITYGEFARTLLFIGERDKLAREDVERAIRQRERWQDLDPWN